MPRLPCALAERDADGALALCLWMERRMNGTLNGVTLFLLPLLIAVIAFSVKQVLNKIDLLHRENTIRLETFERLLRLLGDKLDRHLEGHRQS